MLSLPPPPSKQTNSASLQQQQIVTSKQLIRNQTSLESQASNRSLTLWQPRHEKTEPIIWFAAILCLIFSLLLIFFGIATLILYLAIKPRNPTFDIPNASLNVVYFDSPQYFNGDFTILANFSNPNKRFHVNFESLDIEIFLSERLISSLSLKAFSQRPKETRLQSLNFMSNLVFLPQDVGVGVNRLQKQVQSNNRVEYNVRGTFKVRFSVLGIIHMSYWLHSVCQIEMTGPPAGVLVARQCITKRLNH